MEHITASDLMLGILALTILQLKHFVFDFVLQTRYQLDNKGTYGHLGGVLHASLHAAGTGLAVSLVGPGATVVAAIVAGELLLHYHVDWVHSQLRARSGAIGDRRTYRLLGLDQLMHQLTYVGIALLFVANAKVGAA